MDQSLLTKDELRGFARLTNIMGATGDLITGPWRIVIIPDKTPMFVQRDDFTNASAVIQRCLTEAGIKVELSKDQNAVLVRSEDAAKITRAQQYYAWERVSLELGGSVFNKRIERLERIFSALKLAKKSQPIIRYNAASHGVVATIPIGNELTVARVQNALSETDIKVGRGKRIHTVTMAEPQLLALNTNDAERGRYALYCLIERNRLADQMTVGQLEHGGGI